MKAIKLLGGRQAGLVISEKGSHETFKGTLTNSKVNLTKLLSPSIVSLGHRAGDIGIGPFWCWAWVRVAQV
jgi:hypothetical protein